MQAQDTRPQGLAAEERLATSWGQIAAQFGLREANGPQAATQQAQRALEQIARLAGLPQSAVGLGGSLALSVEAQEADPLALRGEPSAQWSEASGELRAPVSMAGFFAAWHEAAEAWLLSPASPSKTKAKQQAARLDKAIESLPAASAMERQEWVEWPVLRAQELTETLLADHGEDDPHALARKLGRLAQGNEKPLAVGQAAVQGASALATLSGAQKERLGALWRESAGCRAARARFAERNRDAKRMSAFALAAAWQAESEASARPAPKADPVAVADMAEPTPTPKAKGKAKSAEAVADAGSASAGALRSRAAQAFFAQERGERARRACDIGLWPTQDEAERLEPVWRDFWRQISPLLAEGAKDPKVEGRQEARGEAEGWTPPAKAELAAKLAHNPEPVLAPSQTARRAARVG
jgi:hypothetical protein